MERLKTNTVLRCYIPFTLLSAEVSVGIAVTGWVMVTKPCLGISALLGQKVRGACSWRGAGRSQANYLSTLRGGNADKSRRVGRGAIIPVLTVGTVGFLQGCSSRSRRGERGPLGALALHKGADVRGTRLLFRCQRCTSLPLLRLLPLLCSRAGRRCS